MQGRSPNTGLTPREPYAPKTPVAPPVSGINADVTLIVPVYFPYKSLDAIADPAVVFPAQRLSSASFHSISAVRVLLNAPLKSFPLIGFPLAGMPIIFSLFWQQLQQISLCINPNQSDSTDCINNDHLINVHHWLASQHRICSNPIFQYFGARVIATKQ